MKFYVLGLNVALSVSDQEINNYAGKTITLNKNPLINPYNAY